MSNFEIEGTKDVVNSNYTILLPSLDEFLSPYKETFLENPEKELLQNHIIRGQVDSGVYESFSGLRISIERIGEDLQANGLTLKPCSISKDGSNSYYVLEGVLNQSVPLKEPGFLNFALPSLNDDQLQILKEYGPKFYEHWRAHQTPFQRKLNHLIILVPNDEEVHKIHEDQVVQLLASQVITSHTALDLNTVGHGKNLLGENVSILTLNEKSIVAGGNSAQDLKVEGNVSFYRISSPLLVTGDIISKNPAFNYDENEIISAFVPELTVEMKEVLRQMQIHKFVQIWKEVQAASQTHYANTKENLCALPKRSGPCKQNIPMFYFDGENCRPFIFGGCDGNMNRFETLLECAESCINDPTKKKKINQEICHLSRFQPLTTKLKCDRTAKVFGYEKSKGFCVPLSLNSTHGCFMSESLFNSYQSCSELCENSEEESQMNQILKPPTCSHTKSCEHESYTEPETKWVHNLEEGKCLPLKTDCLDPGFYDFEVDCLKACGTNSDKVLTIFAPTDDAIENLPKSIWVHNSMVNGDLAKKYVLPFFVRENSSVERPSVYSDSTFRVVLMHSVPKIMESREEQPFLHLRSDEERKTFVPFDGLTVLKKEFLEKNKFVEYNEVYESIYRLLNTKKFNSIHKAISEIDTKNKDLTMNEHNATARGFCRQNLSHGEPDVTFPNNMTRYFFNDLLGSCQSFQYSGIGGNANNFHSYSECADFCGKFEGIVAEVEFSGRQGISGKVLLAQSAHNQRLYLEASLDGLKPDSPYAMEAGLTKLVTLNSSAEGTAMISRHMSDVNDLPELSSIINYKMIIRDLDGESVDNDNIVAHGSIVGIPSTLEARANILHENNYLVRGEVTLMQDGPFAPVSVTGFVEGIMEGEHGFHIHEIGSTSNGCKAAGPHFNPHGKSHGGPSSNHRHVGDLGNVQVYWGSNLELHLMDDVISLYQSTNSIIGRTIVIHEKKDDLGLSGDFSSLTTGNAGPRVACGIVEKKSVSSPGGDASDALSSKTSSENVKGKIFFIPNDSVMNLIMEDESVSVTESLREFAFCHYSSQIFDFEVEEKNYTTECGFEVNIVRKPSIGRGYEIFLNDVRAEKVIRDGRNTFFVIPFFFHIDDEKIKKEASNSISFRKSGHAIIPPGDKLFGDMHYSSNEEVEFKQESPQSFLLLTTFMEPPQNGEKNQIVHVRVMNSADIYPICPEFKNDSIADLGTLQFESWNRIYTLKTNSGSLYGRDSIIGRVLVFYLGDKPLKCGIVRKGKKHQPQHNPHSRSEPWRDVPLLRLPPQDQTLKSRARELGINLFFDAWDAALRNGIAITSDEETDVTLITLDDGNFQGLIPRPANPKDHPCAQDLFFQYKILGIMIIREKIDVDVVQDRRVLIPKSIGGYEFTFTAEDNGTIKVENYAPLRSETTNSTNLFLMSRSLFMRDYFLGPGDVFDSYDRSKYRVKYPLW